MKDVKFNQIDVDKWNRKEYYIHYMNELRCTYSLTVNIDITGLRAIVKEMGKRIYPVQIYMIATVVNQYQEFRMDTNSYGKLGYWDEVNPSYTVFNKNSETFSSIWTNYNRVFSRFYDSCIEDIDKYSQSTSLKPKQNEPSNIFTISVLPWVNFTGFNINVFNEGQYLLPIFTIGKFIETENSVLMPLSIQVHHAICDGIHLGKFVELLQNLSSNHKEWLL